MTNADVTRLINSDEVQSVVAPPKHTQVRGGRPVGWTGVGSSRSSRREVAGCSRWHGKEVEAAGATGAAAGAGRLGCEELCGVDTGRVQHQLAAVAACVGGLGSGCVALRGTCCHMPLTACSCL
jgi:hypothetical protein